MEHCNACGHARPLRDGICEWCRKALDKEPVACGYVVDSEALTALADVRAVKYAVAASAADSHLAAIALAALRALEHDACTYIPEDREQLRQLVEYRQRIARHVLRDLRDESALVTPWRAPLIPRPRWRKLFGLQA